MHVYMEVLKFLCGLDHHTERSSLYISIHESSHPKLLQHLLQFRELGKFKCYNAAASSESLVMTIGHEIV